MSEPGVESVLVTLAGAVQPDASGGVGDPLARHAYLATACLHQLHDRCRLVCKFCNTPCNCPCHDGGVTPAPALRDRLARWQFDSERLGWTGRSRNTVWRQDAADRERYRAWADALLVELGREVMPNA